MAGLAWSSQGSHELSFPQMSQKQQPEVLRLSRRKRVFYRSPLESCWDAAAWLLPPSSEANSPSSLFPGSGSLTDQLFQEPHKEKSWEMSFPGSLYAARRWTTQGEMMLNLLKTSPWGKCQGSLLFPLPLSISWTHHQGWKQVTLYFSLF